MAPTNKAAYYPADKAPTVEVAASPYPTPEANEVIIRVSAVAINPADWKIQSLGSAVIPGLAYPYAAGFDVSGTIVENRGERQQRQRRRPGAELRVGLHLAGGRVPAVRGGAGVPDGARAGEHAPARRRRAAVVRGHRRHSRCSSTWASR
ncbi:hypothetical protein EKO27_g9032, partial [Xylaria grammica]